MATYPQGQRMDAGRVGTKIITVGHDASSFQFSDLQAAHDFAQNNDTIEVEPGTYTLTAAFAWSKPLTIVCMNGIATFTHALTANLFTINVPALAGSALTYQLKNLTLTHTNAAGGDTINIDNNGGAAVDLTVNIIDCNVSVTGTGYAINAVQTTTSKDIVLNVTGSPLLHSIGKTYITNAKALSCANFYGVYLTSDITLPAGNAVASVLNVWNCLVVGAAVTTGGNAANITNYVSNIKATAGFKAALAATAAGDFDALGTELSLGVAAV